MIDIINLLTNKGYKIAISKHWIVVKTKTGFINLERSEDLEEDIKEIYEKVYILGQ